MPNSKHQIGALKFFCAITLMHVKTRAKKSIPTKPTFALVVTLPFAKPITT